MARRRRKPQSLTWRAVEHGGNAVWGRVGASLDECGAAGSAQHAACGKHPAQPTVQASAGTPSRGATSRGQAPPRGGGLSARENLRRVPRRRGKSRSRPRAACCFTVRARGNAANPASGIELQHAREPGLEPSRQVRFLSMASPTSLWQAVSAFGQGEEVRWHTEGGRRNPGEAASSARLACRRRSEVRRKVMEGVHGAWFCFAP